MLELKNLSTGYGANAVVRDAALRVGEKEIVALVGANGAGKSTLVKAISGVLPAQGGDILFAGQSIARLSTRERVRLGIVHVPEGRQVFAGLSIAENLRLGAWTRRSGPGGAALDARIREVCERFPVLLARLDEPAGTLSGGQQQMLAIARGLMAQPKLLLLDEPSLGLSPLLVTEIFRLIQTLRAQGIAILLAEQNARLSLRIADRGYVVETGRIVLEGSGEQLLRSADVAERYLGVGKTLTDATRSRGDDLATRLRQLLA
jgi:branched-chain amino acid transport system ATP-binding protein